jgi:hypothetical protein
MTNARCLLPLLLDYRVHTISSDLDDGKWRGKRRQEMEELYRITAMAWVRLSFKVYRIL